MIDIEKLKPLIIEKLKPLNPVRIILFGSYAYGTPNENSDVDLYIVTNDDIMPETWKEKSDIYQKTASYLEDITNMYQTDLIVHTKKMHEKFLEMDSMFSRKIFSQGDIIL